MSHQQQEDTQFQEGWQLQQEDLNVQQEDLNVQNEEGQPQQHSQSRPGSSQKSSRSQQGVFDSCELIEFPEPGCRYGESVCAISEMITPHLLYSAYMQGVFPWFDEDEGEPVVWHSPDPRFVLKMDLFHVPKSIDRFLKRSPYTYTMDRDFSGVINGCRNMDRPDQGGTWIGRTIIESYTEFHKLGYAHSVEVWHGEKLVGGLYGVLIGSVFCGESMFTVESDSAKSAFVLFARAFEKCGGKMIDSQVYTDNIARYGATNISRDAFLRLEEEYLHKPLERDLKECFEEMVAEFPKTR